MSKPNSFKRWLAGILAVSMAVTSAAIPVGADEAGKSLNFWKTDINANPRPDYDRPAVEELNIPDDQVVRVSIVLEDESTIDAGYDIDTLAVDPDAIAYRDELRAEQETVEEKIEKQVLKGKDLDVVWNLTLAANLISANVEYGQIEKIKSISGVKDVILETQYAPAATTATSDKPNMGPSSSMIGSGVAYAGGYTGAGSIVAIIDTGIDIDHQSFDANAFEYSLNKLGYTGSLLTEADVAAVLTQLNIYANGNADASKLYNNTKVPFAYNYVDTGYDITHDNDKQGEHGSHVTGIAAANAYIPNGDGTYSPALDTVLTQGVAPDAQVLTMKVFGKGGGANDSDYMAAIEDAILLGADSINLSLGSSVVGFGHSDLYEDVMDSLIEHGAVVTMSAGNSGYWAENSNNGYLYSDDVSFATGGSPGSYTHSLGIASIDNDGATGEYLKVGDELIFYNQTSGYGNPPYSTLAGKTFDFVVIDNFNLGSEEETFAALADIVEGKIAVCYRGVTNFAAKANAAWKNGAVGVIVINNQPGIINMDLTGYLGKIPAVSITYADGEILWDAITSDGTSSNGVYYGIGSLTVGQGLSSTVYGSDNYTMSSFSSWGVPGTLELKPEITAPGGNIYSVNGLPKETDQYELMSGTSMAAPQVAGMTAVLAQYIRENDLITKTGLTQRQLVHSLLMSTAVPVVEDFGGYENSAGETSSYYSVLNQGAGLANVGAATQAHSYIMMDESATLDPNSAKDGKVKVELGETNGKFSFTFTITNFSDEEMTYTLDTSLFTQDIYGAFLDTWTVSIDAAVSYDYEDNSTDKFDDSFSHDVNKDGFTTRADAQAILEYLTSGDDTGLDLDAADVDGDESVTTFDAYLILVAMKELVVVPAGESVEVTVNVEVTEDLSDYVNGAYIEGYTFVEPLANDEGALDVTYSIPILGFYGNWTDPSMYEAMDFLDAALGYETGRHNAPYVSPYNNALFFEGADGEEYLQMGNPYGPEDVFPADKLAIRSDATLTEYDYALIRNAATVATVITDANGKVLDLNVIKQDQYSEFYYTNGGSWQYTSYAASMNNLISDLGVKEGDVINVSLVAIPEYYGTHLSAAQVEAVLPELGDGAFLTTTMTVDDTAPVVPEGGIIDNGDGTITVTVKDNENVAYVALISRSGAILFDDEPVVKGDSYTLSTEDVTGQYAAVFVADYAGNEAAYEFQYGDPIDWEGTMFGSSDEIYTDSNGAAIDAWLTFDPATVDIYGGEYELMDATPEIITAAAYADGYIFQLGADGALYVAPIDDPGYFQHEVAYLDFTAVDMAFNYADSQLYALDDDNGIWKINPLNGKQEYVGYVYDDYLYFAMGLTIDKDGVFYLAAYGIDDDGYAITNLYCWIDDEDYFLDYYGETLILADTVAADIDGYAGVLGYDYDNDLIYMAADTSLLTAATYRYNDLFVIDPETGDCDYTNYDVTYSSLFVRFNSIFVVPSETVDEGAIDEDAKVEVNVTVNTTELHLLKGGKANLNAIVSPWTLADTSVTWSSADTSIATVDANGRVSAVGVGETIITAAAKADPTKTATVAVTVEPVPSVDLRGHIWDAEGNSTWSKFNTSTLPKFDVLSDSPAFYAGTMNLFDDLIYAVDDSAQTYVVDPETFEYELVVEEDNGLYYGDATFAYAGTMYNEADTLTLTWGTSVYFVYVNDAGEWWGYAEDLYEDYGLIDSPIAAITFEGYMSSNSYGGYTDLYLMVLENGDIYQFAVFYGTYGNVTDGYLGVNAAKLGNIGITLPDASYGDGTSFASLLKNFYSDDEDYEHLYLSYYNNGDDTAHIAMIDIDMETGEPVIIADAIDFDDDVWPAVALYQDGNDAQVASSSYVIAANDLDVIEAVNTAGVQKANKTSEKIAAAEADAEAVPELTGALNSVTVDEIVEDTDIIDVTEIDDEVLENIGNALTIGEAVVDTDKNTVTITVSADRATNALYELVYDSDVLTLTDVDRLTVYSSDNKDDGSVILNFASADAVSKDVNVLVFTYDEEDEAGLKTDITLNVYEIGVETEDGLLEVLGGDEENPVAQDTAPIELYEVSIDLGDHGTTDAPSVIVPGEDLDFTITPDDGYVLPETITILIDGKVLDPSNYTYDPVTGKVHIPGEFITGKVEVIVEFVKLDPNPDTALPMIAIVPAIVSGAVLALTRKRRR